MVNYMMRVEPFSLPNFLKVGGPNQSKAEEHVIDVGEMSDEQAEELWTAMRDVWMRHVQARRTALGKENR